MPECFVIMESWLSGRKRLTANEVSLYRDRGFESRTLRKTKSELASDYVLRECILRSEATIKCLRYYVPHKVDTVSVFTISFVTQRIL